MSGVELCRAACGGVAHQSLCPPYTDTKAVFRCVALTMQGTVFIFFQLVCVCFWASPGRRPKGAFCGMYTAPARPAASVADRSGCRVGGSCGCSHRAPGAAGPRGWGGGGAGGASAFFLAGGLCRTQGGRAGAVAGALEDLALLKGGVPVRRCVPASHPWPVFSPCGARKTSSVHNYLQRFLMLT